MKKLILLLTLILSVSIYAQENESGEHNYDKTTILYKTLEDFQAGKGQNVGTYWSFSWSSWGANAIYTNKTERSDDKYNLNDYWGFSVGDFIFRMSLKKGPHIPLAVLKNKNKIFYCEGYMFLDMIRSNTTAGMTTRTADAIFYSDSLGSDIMEITKIIKNEKDNAALAEFVQCIKKGKGRHGYQAQFNAFYDCITNY